MTTMDEVRVSVDAPPERVWALVTDIAAMGALSPENRGGRWLGRPRGPAVGASFVGWNGHGPLRWPTRCRVVECDAPHRFAFDVAGNGMRWGWLLEPDGGGTRLTQWREHVGRAHPLVGAFVASGAIGRDRERLMVDGMHRTVGALKTRAEAPR